MDQKKAGALVGKFCTSKSPERCARCKIEFCKQKGRKTWKKKKLTR